MTLQEKAKAWFGEYKVWDDEPEPRWKSELESLDCFEAGEKDALMQLADGGDIHAICALLVGATRKERSYMEEFEDEETGEKLSIPRCEYLDGVTFELTDDEKARLWQTLNEVKADIDDRTLRWTVWHLQSQAGMDCTALNLERLRRGDEEAAEYIDDPVLLQQFCAAGNRYAAYALYEKYYYGDEKHGIFIDRQRAREYYDLAGDIPFKDEWNDNDDPGEAWPSTYEYTLTGDADTLGAIRTMLYDLCKRFGIPENEEDGLGLFIPQRQLMKRLVGSDTEYYRGNIQYIEGPSPVGEGQEGERLVITTEADNGAPLLYALRQCFPSIEVEMN